MVYKSLDSLDPRKVIFSASCCSVENGSQHHPSLDITKNILCLISFAQLVLNMVLIPVLTKNIFSLPFLLNLKMVPFWSQSNYFLSTFFKCHTFLAELSWSVPFPSGGWLRAAFWHISDVIFSTIKCLSLLSHFKLPMIPLLPFKLPMIPLLPLVVGLELDNNLTVASYLSLFEQKST